MEANRVHGAQIVNAGELRSRDVEAAGCRRWRTAVSTRSCRRPRARRYGPRRRAQSHGRGQARSTVGVEPSGGPRGVRVLVAAEDVLGQGPLVGGAGFVADEDDPAVEAGVRAASAAFAGEAGTDDHENVHRCWPRGWSVVMPVSKTNSARARSSRMHRRRDRARAGGLHRTQRHARGARPPPRRRRPWDEGAPAASRRPAWSAARDLQADQQLDSGRAWTSRGSARRAGSRLLDPGEREHVVLTERMERDVPGQDELVVALIVWERGEVERAGVSSSA